MYHRFNRIEISGNITAGRPPLIVFDFDGTICDSFESMIATLNTLSDEYHFKKIEPSDIPKLRKLEIKQVLQASHIAWYRLPFLVAKMRKNLSAKIPDMMPFEGTQQVLKNLRAAGFSLGILTSNSMANVKNFLEKHDLEQFDFIMTGSSVFGKSRHLKMILKQANLKSKRENVFYVGDETRDIEAAQQAGYRAIAVTWGFNDETALQKKQPALLLNHWDDIQQIDTLVV